MATTTEMSLLFQPALKPHRATPISDAKPRTDARDGWFNIMSNDEKPRDAIPGNAFPLPPTKTQEQRTREGDPPPKQVPAKKPAP